MALELKLYELLPPLYEEHDDAGFLKDFLDGIQNAFEYIYSQEQLVRHAQDIDLCEPFFHRFIAQMLDWELESESPDAQKFELKWVAELYDLKGTYYGILLYARLSLLDYLLSVLALYDQDISTWPELQHMVSGTGADVSITLLNGPMGFAAWGEMHQKFSHVIFSGANKDNYEFGYARPRFLKLKKRLHFMKAARSTSYPYFVYSEHNDLTVGQHPYQEVRAKSIQAISDLDGVNYLGQSPLSQEWLLGRHGPPVHDEMTALWVDRPIRLSDQVFLDGAWLLGEVTHEAHTVLQVR